MRGKLIRSSYSSRTYESDKFKLTKEWDNKSASHIYRLYNRYETVADGFSGAHYQWHKVSEGDEDWAARTAEHYSLKVEES